MQWEPKTLGKKNSVVVETPTKHMLENISCEQGAVGRKVLKLEPFWKRSLVTVKGVEGVVDATKPFLASHGHQLVALQIELRRKKSRSLL